jgi:hypothetical protein
MYDDFDDDAKVFLIQLDRLLETIKKNKTPFSKVEISKYCTQIIDDICDFYQAIMDLYPQGETNNAVQDIYNLNRDAYQPKLQ